MDYPSLEDVYDLSTDDLKKLQQSLRNSPEGHEQLLESVSLQIQERKALEFFAELCKAENPYAKKVAAFNQQFLKLAAEAIEKNHNARTQGIGYYQPSQISQPSLIQPKKQKTQSKQQLQQFPHNSVLNISQYSSTSSHKMEQKQKQQQLHQIDNQNEADSRSVQSENYSHSDAVSTTTATTGTGHKSQNNKKQEQANSSRVTEVKMNLGAKKGGKGKINILKNTLARTLVEDDGIIKRNIDNSPAVNPYKKPPYIPGQKNQAYQNRSKKSNDGPQQASQKSIQSNTSKNSEKTKIPTSKAISQDSKKTKQIAAKIKQQHKKGAVKLPKINQYKDLVEMVKQQEEKKKERANRAQLAEKLPQIDSHINVSRQQIQSRQQKTHLLQQKSLSQHEQIKQQQQLQQNQLQDTIKQQLNQEQKKMRRNSASEKVISSNDVIEEEQMEESLSPEKISKNIQQFNNKNAQNIARSSSSKNIQKNRHSFQNNIKQRSENNQNNSTKPKLSINENKTPQTNQLSQACNIQRAVQQGNTNKNAAEFSEFPNQEAKLSTQQANSAKINSKLDQLTKNVATNTKTNTNANANATSNAKQHMEDVDYTKKLIQQIQKQQQNQYFFYNTTQNKPIDYQTDQYGNANQFKLIQNQEQKQKKDKIKDKEKNEAGITDSQASKSPQSVSKKCYSEQYWAHIRQQAQLKIKRFKQQKQLQQTKQHNKSSQQQPTTNNNQQSRSPQSPVKQPSPAPVPAPPASTPTVSKPSQSRVTHFSKKPKKPVLPSQPLPIAKPLHPLPQFPYLQVYPTFNHIFSIMYLKPPHQALAQIGNLYRQVKSLFSTHLEQLSNRGSFKPALFLPFDNGAIFQVTDPKQLIAHAQETYVDLKVMMDRVRVFNENLHGEFGGGSTENMYYRVVKTKEEVYDIITTSFMRRHGWKELPHGCSLRSSWNLFWSWSKPDIDLNKLLIWQKINHFPFNKNLSRKDLLYKNLDLFRKAFKVQISFLPLTFNLPKQFSQLSSKFHQQQLINKNNNFWIMKPIGKSRGRGIKVVSSLSQLNYTDNIVVQKYIANPLLIDGYKFDMRIYVLVTSFHPLEAFVYREGFARLSTEKYTLDAHSIGNTFVHLTNFAINKNNVSNNSNFVGGSKISLKSLKDKITRMGYSFANIWTQVHQIIVKSLLGCSVSVPSFPTAFQLFGYDIMVDQQGNCHLIQINASPSLQRSYMIDQIVKQNLIDDIIDIVDPPDFDKKQLIEVLNERIQAMTNKRKLTPEDDLIGLARILRYKPVRKIGQKPSKMGLFQIVAPCDISRELQTLIKAKSGANNPMNID